MRLATGRIEHVLSLTIQTDPDGLIVVVLSVDMLHEEHGTVNAMTLAMYPLASQPHAQEDGLLLSRKWELSLRRANQGVPWTYVRMALSGEPSNASDLLIGG